MTHSFTGRPAGERDYGDTAALVRRILVEYREMPGLKLTAAQAARLWHVELARCEAVLDALVGDGHLQRTRHGAYVVFK